MIGNTKYDISNEWSLHNKRPDQHTDESTVWTEICSAKIDLVLVFHFMSLLTSTSSLVTNLKKKKQEPPTFNICLVTFCPLRGDLD